MDPWVIPDGHEILPPDAPREQWLAERRRGIGGSDIPLLLGVANPNHGSEYGLWLDKTGRNGHDDGPTGAMLRGTWLEPPLAGIFSERTGLEVRPLGLCQWDGDEILRATPDRASSDGGIVEIKSIGEYATIRHEWRGGGVSRAAYAQLQTEMLVTGRYPGWLLAYEIDRDPIIRGPFAPDRELQLRIAETARRWWDAHVVTDTPPPVDLGRISDEEIRARWPRNVGEAIEAEFPYYVRMMLEEREAVHEQMTAAEKRKKEIDRALRVMAGDYAALTIDGEPVVTFADVEGGPSVAPELEWEMPEVWAKYVRRSQSRRINIVRKRKGS